MIALNNVGVRAGAFTLTGVTFTIPSGAFGVVGGAAEPLNCGAAEPLNCGTKNKRTKATPKIIE